MAPQRTHHSERASAAEHAPSSQLEQDQVEADTELPLGELPEGTGHPPPRQLAWLGPLAPPGWLLWPSGRRWLRGLRRMILIAVAVLISGNLAVLAAFGLARLTEPAGGSAQPIEGIGNLRQVDEGLLRGNGPDDISYAAMPAAGVTTVVDLRAERDIVVPERYLEANGISRHHLPIRDGQTPRPEQVARFREIMAEAEGTVYVHCGAGVGRAGAMVAAYLVGTGEASPAEALRLNLSVGPPSLEQIYYVLAMEQGEIPDQPPLAVSAVSRLFDAPRRIWSVIRS